nr:MOSC domain-containing protein [Nocardioides sp.]
PPEPLPVQRFRPSLVIDGEEPFVEDHWSYVDIAGVRFRMAMPNGRCVVTTLDIGSLRTGKEPIRTLARHRRSGSDTLFAVNLIPEGTGTIRVGDEVSVG